MATTEDNSNEEIQEITADHNGRGFNEVDLAGDASSGNANDGEVQGMEIETENEEQATNQSENEVMQPVNNEHSAPAASEMQSSMQNTTPTVVRNIQVLHSDSSSAVNSPDDFQLKASKSSKVKPLKIAKSPLKSPEKDDDVGLLSTNLMNTWICLFSISRL